MPKLLSGQDAGLLGSLAQEAIYFPEQTRASQLKSKVESLEKSKAIQGIALAIARVMAQMDAGTPEHRKAAEMILNWASASKAMELKSAKTAGGYLTVPGPTCLDE